MIISLKTYLTDNDIYTADNIKVKIKNSARRYIALSPMKASELELNRYLIKTMSKSLKGACLDILYNSNISIDENKEIIITFKTKEIDQLAELITFGTGRVPGSKILMKAFRVLENK